MGHGVQPIQVPGGMGNNSQKSNKFSVVVTRVEYLGGCYLHWTILELPHRLHIYCQCKPDLRIHKLKYQNPKVRDIANNTLGPPQLKYVKFILGCKSWKM